MPISQTDVDEYIKRKGIKPAPAPTPASGAAPPSNRPGWQEPMINPPAYGFETEPEARPVGAAPLTPPAAPPAEVRSSGAELDPNSPEFSYRAAATRGLERGVGQTGLDVLGLAKFLDQHGFGGALQTLTKQVPGAQEKVHELREFVNRPGQSRTERIAEGLGEIAPMLAVPEFGIEEALTKVGQRAFIDAIMKQGKTYKEAMKIFRRYRTAGKFGGAATQGAIGGAITDPEHPVTGAAEGAVGGAALRGAARGLRSETGQEIASHLLPEAVYYATHAATGIPWWFGGPLLARRYTKTGRRIGRAIEKGTEKVGRQLERVNPAIAPAVAGQAQQGLSSSGLNMSDHDVAALNVLIQQMFGLGP